MIWERQKNGNYQFITYDKTLEKWEHQVSGLKIMIDFSVDKEGNVTDLKLKY